MEMSSFKELAKRTLTGLILLGCFIGSYLHTPLLYSFFLIGVLGIILIFEWPKLLSPKLAAPFKVLVSLFYPILPFLSLIWLTYRFHGLDVYFPLYPFVVAWSADTGGYIVGKLIGHHKIYPSISPGKSWEGLLGSWLAVIGAHLFFVPRSRILRHFIKIKNIKILLAVALAGTIIAFFGGFLLSYLKRKQNLKDAGTILPGHGGFLDRFDSVMAISIATTAIAIIILYRYF